MKILRIATRNSPLALWQAEWIALKLRQSNPGLEIRLVPMVSSGDRIAGSGVLAEFGGKGLFIKELEQALLEDTADLAVHSSKDVPTELPQGFSMIAVARRDDPRDALVTLPGAASQLSPGLKIGTVSLRRRRFLSHSVPDLSWTSLRGNLGTRLDKLAAGQCQALVLAVSGLSRLYRFVDHKFNILPLSAAVCPPAAGQGAICVEALSSRDELVDIVSGVNDPSSFLRVTVERRVCRLLGADCGSALGVLAEVGNGMVQLQAAVVGTDSTKILRCDKQMPLARADELADSVAESMLAQGAGELLRE